MFDYQNMSELLVPAKMYPVMSKIDGYRLRMEQNKEKMQLIYSDCQRLSLLTLNRMCPFSATGIRTEEKEPEIYPGFAFALKKTWDETEDRRFSVDFICRLHKALMGVKYPGGTVREEAAKELENLCRGYEEARYDAQVPGLLLISALSYDFLSIRPFESGNEQLMEILLYMLLAQKGYSIGRYVIFDASFRVFEKMAAELQENTFCDFSYELLEWIKKLYESLEERMEPASSGSFSKMDRIDYVFNGTLIEMSKREIHSILPDVSVTTLELYLAELCKRGTLQKSGAGRLVAYSRLIGQVSKNGREKE